MSSVVAAIYQGDSARDQVPPPNVDSKIWRAPLTIYWGWINANDDVVALERKLETYFHETWICVHSIKGSSIVRPVGLPEYHFLQYAKSSDSFISIPHISMPTLESDIVCLDRVQSRSNQKSMKSVCIPTLTWSKGPLVAGEYAVAEWKMKCLLKIRKCVCETF